MSGEAIVSTARPRREEPIIRIPALGLTVRVRFPFEADKAQATVIETTNAAGFGPPLHRRAESETFEIVTGRYLFEVDGRRFIARRGDLVRVPAGAARAFVNVTGTGARQQVIIEPGIDAVRFFRELAALLDGKATDRAALRSFGRRWGVVLLGAPLKVGGGGFDGEAP
ncbi:cupin domain-containing protein [Variovorax sp. J22R133]|uniref:cupin domain-containing protein n=1 Tax=Variovorax brevis TaxID=3053503 RepID=UPI00257659A4|nr:cupin domain-containing protein [Variovorax sp. J22R133]MDM0115451.1 cupin domain-containing protein [Variovorax sp. J22R133]